MAACMQAESMLGDALRELEAVTQERFALHDRLLSCEAVPLLPLSAPLFHTSLNRH
jgi:hypothetical protein